MVKYGPEVVVEVMEMVEIVVHLLVVALMIRRTYRVGLIQEWEMGDIGLQVMQINYVKMHLVIVIQ